MIQKFFVQLENAYWNGADEYHIISLQSMRALLLKLFVWK